MIPYVIKKRVLNCVPCSYAFCMVDFQHIIHQVKYFIDCFLLIKKFFILSIYIFIPLLSFEIFHFAFNFWSKLQSIFLYIFIYFLTPNYFCNLYELVKVISSLKKRFILKNHPGKHAPCAPNIKLIIIIGHSN